MCAVEQLNVLMGCLSCHVGSPSAQATGGTAKPSRTHISDTRNGQRRKKGRRRYWITPAVVARAARDPPAEGSQPVPHISGAWHDSRSWLPRFT